MKLDETLWEVSIESRTESRYSRVRGLACEGEGAKRTEEEYSVIFD